MIRNLIHRNGKSYLVFTVFTAHGWLVGVWPAGPRGEVTGERIDARSAADFSTAIKVHLSACDSWRPPAAEVR